MKIDHQAIDQELKRTGMLVNWFTKNAGEKSFQLQYFLRKLQMPLPKELTTENRWIIRKNKTKLRLRIYQPLNRTKKGPAILWMHGGGYATGAPELSAQHCRQLIEKSEALIVAPDYQLSVKEPYPAALADCYLALTWLKNHAEELGGRNDQIVVGGESAGGGLAAALTLLARDKKDVNIAFQLPLFPMIDDRMNSNSARDNDAPVWNAKNNDAAWQLYLGRLFKTNRVPVYAAPARTTDFSGLPPAISFVGDLDPFLDETLLYFHGLRQAGIFAECKVYPGCYHAFNMVCPKAAISRRAMDEFLASFVKATQTYFVAQP